MARYVDGYVLPIQSRAHRDRVNSMVMKDPRLADMNARPIPFDLERMTYGGFKAIVHL